MWPVAPGLPEPTVSLSTAPRAPRREAQALRPDPSLALGSSCPQKPTAESREWQAGKTGGLGSTWQEEAPTDTHQDQTERTGTQTRHAAAADEGGPTRTRGQSSWRTGLLQARGGGGSEKQGGAEGRGQVTDTPRAAQPETLQPAAHPTP